MNIQPVTLAGTHVRLEALTEAHVPALWEVAQHEEIWRYMPFRVDSFERFSAYTANMLKLAEAGTALPFVTVQIQGNLAIGSTSYLEINRPHKRLEIGATWITPSHQRSPVNTEAKLLQLRHAFEVLSCNRVEFKTDSLNTKSRTAIARIGGVEEGTFRNHMVMPDGRLRHSVYFSITKDEWPNVRAKLEARLHS